MNRRTILTSSAITALGLVLSVSSAIAQAKSIKDQLVGTWIISSAETTNVDGTKFLPFGPNPKGAMVIDATGHFINLNATSSLPKIASNNRNTETAEENKAITQGSLASFGTYTVNEAEKILILHVEASTFPNWVGQDLRRPINAISANEFTYTNAAPTTGAGSTKLVYKRAE
jgi:hypothetical protein